MEKKSFTLCFQCHIWMEVTALHFLPEIYSDSFLSMPLEVTFLNAVVLITQLSLLLWNHFHV